MTQMSRSLVKNTFALQERLERSARSAFVLLDHGAAWGEEALDSAGRESLPANARLVALARQHLGAWPARRSLAGARCPVQLALDDAEGSAVAGVPLQVVTPSSLSLPGASHDAILLVHVLECLDDSAAAALLEGCRHALAPGGRLVVIGATARRGHPNKRKHTRRLRAAGRRPLFHDRLLRHFGFTVVSYELALESAPTAELVVGIKPGGVEGGESLSSD